jgi:hypothetical protein
VLQQREPLQPLEPLQLEPLQLEPLQLEPLAMLHH